MLLPISEVVLKIYSSIGKYSDELTTDIQEAFIEMALYQAKNELSERSIIETNLLPKNIIELINRC